MLNYVEAIKGDTRHNGGFPLRALVREIGAGPRRGLIVSRYLNIQKKERRVVTPPADDVLVVQELANGVLLDVRHQTGEC